MAAVDSANVSCHRRPAGRKSLGKEISHHLEKFVRAVNRASESMVTLFDFVQRGFDSCFLQSSVEQFTLVVRNGMNSVLPDSQLVDFDELAAVHRTLGGQA